jgi:hypothetical protein
MRLIREFDEFDWIRDVPSTVRFDDLKVGGIYRVVLTDNFKRAVVNCGDDIQSPLFKADRVFVKEVARSWYNSIYCKDINNNLDHLVTSYSLKFYQGTRYIGDFYVVEDMIDFYPIEGTTINESDGLDWIRSVSEPPKLKDYLQNVVDGDKLVLRGDVVNGRTYEKSWVNDFEVTIGDVGSIVSSTNFSIDEKFSDAIDAMGLSETYSVHFIDDDGELYVIKHNGSYVN